MGKKCKMIVDAFAITPDGINYYVSSKNGNHCGTLDHLLEVGYDSYW